MFFTFNPALLFETPKKLPIILNLLLLFFDVEFSIYSSLSDILLNSLSGFYLGVALFCLYYLSESYVFKPRVLVVVVLDLGSLSSEVLEE